MIINTVNVLLNKERGQEKDNENGPLNKRIKHIVAIKLYIFKFVE